MGAICCCFGISSSNDHGNSTNDTFCFRLDGCVQNFRNKCASTFSGNRGHAVSLNNHSAPSSNSMVEHNNNSTVATPALSNSVDPRYSRVPHEDATRRQDNKGSGHSRVEPEPLRDTDVQAIAKSTAEKAELNDASSGKKSKESDFYYTKFFSAKMDFGDSNHSDSEDEDVCPTCLEEYTLENPKIVAKCSHHYHLGCIYEWQERSDLCPVCGKLMTFDEIL